MRGVNATEFQHSYMSLYNVFKWLLLYSHQLIDVSSLAATIQVAWSTDFEWAYIPGCGVEGLGHVWIVGH